LFDLATPPGTVWGWAVTLLRKFQEMEMVHIYTNVHGLDTEVGGGGLKLEVRG